MRDLLTVIDAMLALLPERSIQFRRELEQAKQTDEYLAPEELIHEHWTHTAKVLASYIPAIPQQRQPWQNEVMEIWNEAGLDDFHARVLASIQMHQRSGRL